MELLEKFKDNQSDDHDEALEESSIKWINLIFIPFHPIFKFIVLITVIVKGIMVSEIAVCNRNTILPTNIVTLAINLLQGMSFLSSNGLF